jgi:ABC-2 type transport system permease protein
MGTEIGIELAKMVRRSRTYAGPIIMLLLIIMALLGIKYGPMFHAIQNRLSQDFIITGTVINALLLTRFMLFEPVVYMFMPLFSCIVFGDLLASEAADGTIRTLMCRPISRTRVALSKYLTGAAYAILLAYGSAAVAYTLGLIFLGRGPLVSLTGFGLLPEHTAMIRLLETYGIVALSMIAIGSVAFAISTFVSNSLVTIAIGVGMVIFSSIIGAIDFFEKLRPYLLTTYMSLGPYFESTVDHSLVRRTITVMLAYIVVSLAAALVIFNRRDILS